jgi:hypothetical protein
MRDATVGSMIGGLIICALSWAVVAQSASERHPASHQRSSAQSSQDVWLAARHHHPDFTGEYRR